MKTRTKVALIISLVVLASLACGLTSLLPGGASGGLRATNQLWADVPSMNGLNKSDLEVPLVARIMMQTMLSGLAGGTGNGDFAAFTTSQTPADVQAFYTNERMAAAGWEASEQSTCLNGSDQGYNGVFCVFIKETGSLNTGLMILAAPDDSNAAQTNVFFIRVENQVTPTP